MGNSQSVNDAITSFQAAQQNFSPPPPPKCSAENAEATTWRNNLEGTQRIYEEKRLAAERCSPELAQARAVSGSGPSECQVNDVQLNMARNDVSTKDAKWETCYPEQAVQRRLTTLREEATAYESATKNSQNIANNDFNVKTNAIAKLAESARSMYGTLFEKEKELAELVSKRENYEQYERRERRLFLDNSPQSGVGGAPGVRTADDRVLLTFWILFGTAIISGSILLLQLYGARFNINDTKSKVGIVTLVAFISYGMAYYFISNFG